MKGGYTYTKRDFVAAVCCVVFLVFSLGVIGDGARQRAKEALCLSNLHQWGQMYSLFANDNDGELMGWNEYDWAGGEFVEHAWVPMMYPYYEGFEMCLCPSATNLWSEASTFSSPDAAWDFKYIMEGEIWPDVYLYYQIDGNWVYGSYGKNEWVTKPSDEFIEDDYYAWENFYHNVYVVNGYEVPLFGDCNFMAGFPHAWDEPADTRFHGPVDGGGGEINRWNIARHGLSVNMLFLDWSARKVGLRELWMLKWSRETLEGEPTWGNLNIVPDPDNPEHWPEWMRD
jgi:prepilin-type processing-associated H-X9-DG protein